MSELIFEPEAAGMHTPVAPVDATHGILLYLEGVTVSFDGFKAVSYTHLDVYKRQGFTVIDQHCPDHRSDQGTAPADRHPNHRLNRVQRRKFTGIDNACLLYTSRCV